MSDRAKRAPNALAADQWVCGCSARCVAGLTARAGGSRVVESLLARKEPPSSTVRSRRSSGPRRWENDRKLSLRVQEIHKTTGVRRAERIRLARERFSAPLALRSAQGRQRFGAVNAVEAARLASHPFRVRC